MEIGKHRKGKLFAAGTRPNINVQMSSLSGSCKIFGNSHPSCRHIIGCAACVVQIVDNHLFTLPGGGGGGGGDRQ